MDKLADWPNILMGFRKVMDKVKVPPTNVMLGESRSAAFRLLRMISRNQWSKNYAKIEGNFLIAAMHIACMKELEFSQDSYPDLPEDLEITVDK